MATTITQVGTPATCDCRIRFTASADLDTGTNTATPLEIVETCEVHEAITDVNTLHAAHLADMVPIIAARAVCWDNGATLLAWTIDADSRAVSVTIDDTLLDPGDIAAFRAALVATGVTPTYVD